MTHNMRVGSGGVMLPNHAPLMVMERFKVLEALFPGPDRSRARARAGHRPDHLAGAAAPAGRARRAGRFPRPLPGDDAVREQRLSGEPSVLESRRDADRRAAAADLAARLQRLFGRACGACRRGIFLRASLLGFPARRADAELPQPVQAVGLAPDAVRDPRRRGDLRRYRGRGGPDGDERRPAFRAPRQGRIRSARLARGGRRLSLHADRPPAHRTQPQAPDRRLAGAGARAHPGARGRHQGGRGDDHHDGVRPRGAQTFI